jgi:hypothetical protein
VMYRLWRSNPTKVIGASRERCGEAVLNRDDFHPHTVALAGRRENGDRRTTELNGASPTLAETGDAEGEQQERNEL